MSQIGFEASSRVIVLNNSSLWDIEFRFLDAKWLWTSEKYRSLELNVPCSLNCVLLSVESIKLVGK